MILALELQRCEVGDLDITMDPSTTTILHSGALDIVDRQPEHGTWRDAHNGSKNARRVSSCGQLLLLTRVTRPP